MAQTTSPLPKLVRNLNIKMWTFAKKNHLISHLIGTNNFAEKDQTRLI